MHDAGMDPRLARQGSFLLRLARERLRRAGAGDAESEEVVQDLWARILETRPDLPADEEALQDYLAAAVLNGVRMRLRSRARRRAREAAAVRSPEAPDDPLLRMEEAESLEKALARLDPEARLLLRWIYWDGLPYARIASLLDVRENSVGPRLSRIREELRRILHGEGVPRHA